MPKRVLIVEDNPISLELLTELVQAEGHRVITALSGTEALSLARAELPDLILMDIQLPGLDGLTAIRILKADPETKEIPVVGISAHALREDVERALQAGCVAYLSKPLDTRGFIDLMAGLLGKDAQPQQQIAEAR
jgi:CheY-like chemotaxis protein